MGDRGNIKIGNIYLYTHWGGSEILKDLHNALSKNWRWDDEAYLTRIIFDEMSKGHQGEETGFGISTDICDNEHDMLEVNCQLQRIINIENEYYTAFDTFILANLVEAEELLKWK